MDYPEGFPEDLKLPIERSIAEAEVEFATRNTRRTLEPVYTTDQLMYVYVKSVFFVFARQALEAAAKGIWTLERVRKEVEDYFQPLIADVYSRKCDTPSNDGFEFFREHATTAIQISKEWIRHQKALAALAKSISANEQPRAYKTPSPKEDAGSGNTIAEDRKSLLTAYKADGRQKGIRITDEMLAKAAKPGHWNDRTMVTWWKRDDPRCKPPHDRKIRAVLTRDPSSVWPNG
jgi:hypothetical protein